jgi:hypothetical protein
MADATLGMAESRVVDIETRMRRAPAVPVREARIVHWALRLGASGCYVGHGAFGVITKAAWLPYFAVVGIPEGTAWRLMPAIGTGDILMGILTLVRPMPVVLLYMAVWSLWTALLRPFSGEGWWEFLERAGNSGVPLAFLYWSHPGSRLPDWFAAIKVSTVRPPHPERLAWILRITTATLLIGHGGFGAFMHKAAWVGYFGAVGITPEMVQGASLIAALGWFEIVLGMLVLAKPIPAVVLFVFAWKVGTELLRPIAGEPFWEFVERGGSYAAPLALFYVSRWANAAIEADPLVGKREGASEAAP